MLETNSSDLLINIFFILLIVIILILFNVGLACFLNDFSFELKRINCEINRTEGDERCHWIRKRRRLWLSLIPFVRY